MVARIITPSFFSLGGVSLYAYITIRWTFGLFPVLAITTRAVPCSHTQVFQWTPIVIYLGWMSEVAGSYGTCVFIFHGNSQALCRSGFIPCLFLFPWVELSS